MLIFISQCWLHRHSDISSVLTFVVVFHIIALVLFFQSFTLLLNCSCRKNKLVFLSTANQPKFLAAIDTVTTFFPSKPTSTNILCLIIIL